MTMTARTTAPQRDQHFVRIALVAFTLVAGQFAATVAQAAEENKEQATETLPCSWAFSVMPSWYPSWAPGGNKEAGAFETCVEDRCKCEKVAIFSEAQEKKAACEAKKPECVATEKSRAFNGWLWESVSGVIYGILGKQFLQDQADPLLAFLWSLVTLMFLWVLQLIRKERGWWWWPLAIIIGRVVVAIVMSASEGEPTAAALVIDLIALGLIVLRNRREFRLLFQGQFGRFWRLMTYAPALEPEEEGPPPPDLPPPSAPAPREFCGECGMELGTAETFCGQCGTPRDGVQVAAPVPPPAPSATPTVKPRRKAGPDRGI